MKNFSLTEYLKAFLSWVFFDINKGGELSQWASSSSSFLNLSGSREQNMAGPDSPAAPGSLLQGGRKLPAGLYGGGREGMAFGEGAHGRGL